ncbi:unnamed protein product [Brassicogethes aeneus]|uniref:Uncharacterized protein n=1 Tax=Brassicogethes aeneus TaxID=1431903 RepID=A0A9P0FCI7_BRAAE|nr:unnamed protein product [Brassicogethes aeneus]
MCKRCKSKVANGLKCVVCVNQYHLSCAKLSSNVKIVENGIICCKSQSDGKDYDSDMAFYDAVESTDKCIDSQTFLYIIKQKDIIINELRDKVKILNNQIDLLNKFHVDIPKKHSDAEKTPATKPVKNVNTSNDIPANKNKTTNKQNKILKTQVASALKEVKEKLIMEEIQNLTAKKPENTDTTGIVNRGDSFRRRRSRSNSYCPPHIGGTPSPVLDEPGDHNQSEISNYQVALLGAQGVGKTALISQFMTSEHINAYDRQKGNPIKAEDPNPHIKITCTDIATAGAGPSSTVKLLDAFQRLILRLILNTSRGNLIITGWTHIRHG